MGAISSLVQPLGLTCLVLFVLLWIFIFLRKKKKGAIYFELAPWSSMRLCPQLEETFPDLRGWQVELMKQLCFVAYNYEIYDAVGPEGWLRTTVSLLNPCIFSERSAEYCVISRIAEHCRLTNSARETYWSELQKLYGELVTQVKIHSNIIPREAYREKLNEELGRQQHGLSPPRKFRREFYPIGVLADAVEKSTSASENTKEWRRNGGQCVLARHLRTWNVPHAARRDDLPNRLRKVKKEEVGTAMTNLRGAVQEVSWRNGIYARKKFGKVFTRDFETERDVALRVSHPHVIRPIGQTLDVEGNPCLLMEVLEGHLYRFFVEQSDIARGKNSPVKGPVEILDVLLQIARGLKSLHDAHVVHGDLKPQNILFSHFEISEEVRYFLVKVADFDEAQVVSSPGNFEPSYGTTQYAAPEVLKWTRLKEQDIPFCDPKKPEVDDLPYKLDIYGFGCIAYEVLTGQKVYGGNVICEKTGVVECEGILTKVKYAWTLTKVVKGTLTPDGSIDTSAIDAEQRKCIVWQNLIKMYPPDLIGCLESCWALKPSERPSSSKLCEVLENSKAEMQRRVTEIRNLQEAWKERRKYAFWNFLVPSLIAFICKSC